jgi:multiple sugar transport system permease protein
MASASSRREAIEFYLFISPWLIGLVVFLIYPLVSSLYYSFTRYEIGGKPTWIGLENYVRMFTDPLYLKTIRTTFIFALISVPAISALALGLALVLAQGLKAINAYRAIYFMPSVMQMVAIALTWFYVLRPGTGPLAGVLSVFGIEAQRWLGDEKWALPALILINIWFNFGAQMVISSLASKDPAKSVRVLELTGRAARQVSPSLFYAQPYHLPQPGAGHHRHHAVFDIPYDCGGRTTPHRDACTMGGSNSNGLRLRVRWILFLIIMAITLLVVRSSQAWVYTRGVDDDLSIRHPPAPGLSQLFCLSVMA